MLNKDTLIRAIAAENDLTIKKATEIYMNIVENISGALRQGSLVRLAGIGTLKPVPVSARVIRNPRTGREVALQASRRVKFRPAASLKRIVSE